MTRLKTDKVRDIIDDFAAEIDSKKRKTAKPTKHVIDFRNERADNFERDVWVVPVEILRFRKDNGRIASDVLSYEKNYNLLSETEQEDQKLLGKFLYEKDPQKTEQLKNSMFHGGQRDPAIITCDGFLINGNRRKLAFEKLQEDHPGDERFKAMKVVILPGKKDDGGSPTLKEIEQIENRYQLQSDGKAEYYNFDRALSIRRKIELGVSLEEQLRDDPNFVNLSPREFNKEMKKIDNEFLGPLECVDKYLEYLRRDGLYDTVSKGRDDPEGRWQAFIDYHNNVYKKLKDKKKLIEMGIKEDEIGKIEDVAFKIIRKRDIPRSGKVHMIMRQLPKLLDNTEAKKEILKISEIDFTLPQKDRYDKDGKELDSRTLDKFWGEKYKTEITRQIKRSQEILDHAYQVETPLTLLEAALKKLKHEKMNLKIIQDSDTNEAWGLIRGIRDRIKELERDFYRLQKNLKKDQKKAKYRRKGKYKGKKN